MPRTFDTQPVLRELGRRIRVARGRSGLTQEEAAAKASIDYKRWQRLEQGSVNATVRTLTRVAAAVGLSFWDLIGRAPRARKPSRRRRKS